jgi:triosephosphate isomerase
MRRQIILGNWKMNGSLVDISSLCTTLNYSLSAKQYIDIAVCVPFIYLDFVRLNIAQGISLGAQNVSQYNNGAYTGEISSLMLRDFNCEYVIVGHSERRTLFKETSHIVAKKAKKSIDVGIKPVVCVGETLEERNSGNLEIVIESQIEVLFQHLSKRDMEELIIAYEPLWAIGTGLAATPEQVQSIHAFIRSVIMKFNESLARKIRIIYGGSMNSSNAKDLLSLDHVDGGLIGGASLSGKDFNSIISQAKHVTCY